MFFTSKTVYLDAPIVFDCSAVCEYEEKQINCSFSYEPRDREVEVLGYHLYWKSLYLSNCKDRHRGCHPSTWDLKRYTCQKSLAWMYSSEVKINSSNTNKKMIWLVWYSWHFTNPERFWLSYLGVIWATCNQTTQKNTEITKLCCKSKEKYRNHRSSAWISQCFFL